MNTVSCWMFGQTSKLLTHHQGKKHAFLLFGKSSCRIPNMMKIQCNSVGFRYWSCCYSTLSLSLTDGGEVGYRSSRLLQPITLSVCGLIQSDGSEAKQGEPPHHHQAPELLATNPTTSLPLGGKHGGDYGGQVWFRQFTKKAQILFLPDLYHR